MNSLERRVSDRSKISVVKRAPMHAWWKITFFAPSTTSSSRHGLLLICNILLLALIMDCYVLCFETGEQTMLNKASEVEVRAVFVNCEPDKFGDFDGELLRFQRQELFKHNILKNCKNKLAVTVKLSSDPYSSGEEYIPLDHVFSGPNKKRVRLLNPYIMRLQRQSSLQAYKLQPLEKVRGVLKNPSGEDYSASKQDRFLDLKKRSRPQRDVGSNMFSHLLGSSASLTLEHQNPFHHSFSVKIDSQLNMHQTGDKSNQTLSGKDCGAESVLEQDSQQPYRDKREVYTNMSRYYNNREKQIVKNKRPETTYNNKDSAVKDCYQPHLELTADQFLHKGNTFQGQTKSGYEPISDDLGRKSHTFMPKFKGRRDTFYNLQQTETETFNNIPEANLRATPSKDSPSKHFKHVRFPQRDYALYEIGKPSLWSGVKVQLFEKLSTKDGKTVWNDLTQGEVASVSATNPEWSGDYMSVEYRPMEGLQIDGFTLPQSSLCLLQPIHSNMSEVDDETIVPNYAAAIDDDYIIVPIDDIIGYSNNPKNDEPNEKHGKRRRVEVRLTRALFGGRDESFNVESHGTKQFLTMPHKLPHRSQLDVEVRADDNQLVRAGSSGRISTAISDNTRMTRTIITVQAGNTGLVSARFKIASRECRPELPAVMSDVAADNTVSDAEILPPKHTRKFTIELPVDLSDGDAHCTVSLMNDNDETVAVREVSIKRGDRCFCVWHCDCTCLSEDPKLICRAMPTSRQRAAGLTPRDHPRPTRSLCYTNNVFVNIFSCMICVICFFLLAGIVKAFMGCCCPCLARWGHDLLCVTPRKLRHYHENNLRGMLVQYDDDGHPIHPVTKKRSVRLFSFPVEFFLNVVFFFVMPVVQLYAYIDRSGLFGEGRQKKAKRLREAQKLEEEERRKKAINDEKERKKREVQERKDKEKNKEKQNTGQRQQIQSQPKGDSTRTTSSQKKKSAPALYSRDIQNLDMKPHDTHRQRKLRHWMSSNAEDLSLNLFQEGLGMTREVARQSDNDEMDLYSQEKSDDDDSENEHTEYVLDKMQKSRESLAKLQQKISDSSPATRRDFKYTEMATTSKR